MAHFNKCKFRRLIWSTVFLTLNGTVLGHFEGFSLPDNYHKVDLPNEHTEGFKGKPTKVVLLIHIMDITEVDEIENDISLEMIVRRSWLEHRVQITAELDPQQWHAVEAIDAEKFWKPDFYAAGLREFRIIRGITDLKHFTVRADKTVSETMRIELEVRCKFDFSNYPLDTQQCKFDFMSAMEPADELQLEWDSQTEHPVVFANDDGKADVSLRNFELHIFICTNNFHTKMQWGKVSTLRFWLIMHRQIKPFIIDTYVPTAMFVVMSWGSFLVKPDIVPGRMVLLVTNLLSLVTLFEAIRASTPPANGVKCLDIWILSCITFVFLALLEYAFVLYKMHNKHSEKKPINLRFLSSVHPVEYTPFYLRKVDRRHKRGFFRFLTPLSSRCLICNSSHETWHLLDKVSIVLFPFLFGLYNCVYWAMFLSESMATKSYHCEKN